MFLLLLLLLLLLSHTNLQVIVMVNLLHSTNLAKSLQNNYQECDTVSVSKLLPFWIYCSDVLHTHQINRQINLPYEEGFD